MSDQVYNTTPALAPAPEADRINLAKHSKQAQNMEFIAWEDGTLSIDDWMHHFTGDGATLAHATLTNSQARALRKFLNKPAVKETLGLVSQQPAPAAKRQISLGQHILHINDDRSISIGDHDLDADETYRLFISLRELFL